MKAPDLEKERSEQKLTQEDFLAEYNVGLPDSFVQATATSLEVFRKEHSSLFGRSARPWSLDQHRKKVMD